MPSCMGESAAEQGQHTEQEVSTSVQTKEKHNYSLRAGHPAGCDPYIHWGGWGGLGGVGGGSNRDVSGGTILL